MVTLQAVEVCPLALGSVDVVQRIVGQVIAKIANHKSKPKSKVQLLIVEVEHLVNCQVPKQDSEEG